MATALKIVPSPSRICRLLRHGEPLPDAFIGPFEHLGRLDPNWIWVVESSGRVETVLITAPCHGVIMLWRLVSIPDANKHNTMLIMRQMSIDCLTRGYSGYMINVDASTDVESKIARLFLKSGAVVAGKGVWMAGRFDEGLRRL